MTARDPRQACFPNGQLAVSVKEFARMTNISRSSLYEAIRDGSLVVHKYGNRTVILASDGYAWLNSLPVLRSSCFAEELR